MAVRKQGDLKEDKPVNKFVRQGITRISLDDTIKLKPDAMAHKTFPKRGKMHIASAYFQEERMMKDALSWTTDSLRKGALSKHRHSEFSPAKAHSFFSWVVRQLIKHDLLEVTRAPANEKD